MRIYITSYVQSLKGKSSILLFFEQFLYSKIFKILILLIGAQKPIILHCKYIILFLDFIYSLHHS